MGWSRSRCGSGFFLRAEDEAEDNAYEQEADSAEQAPVLAGYAEAHAKGEAQRHAGEEACDAYVSGHLALRHRVGNAEEQTEEETALVADILQQEN